MAGRGVDIVLGGGDPAQYAKIAQLGGLYVIGTNLHDSRRLDDQLRGRAGRQGDPGGLAFSPVWRIRCSIAMAERIRSRSDGCPRIRTSRCERPPSTA
nr:hypothetical protein [Paenibacillus thiaminolyticus]